MYVYQIVFELYLYSSNFILQIKFHLLDLDPLAK